MPKRINRAIELLEQDQPIYYTGLHTFSKEFLTFEQGKKDAKTWADYINIGMEHGSFDMSGLEAYMYRALKKAKIKAQYEKRTFELIPSFEFNNFLWHW